MPLPELEQISRAEESWKIPLSANAVPGRLPAYAQEDFDPSRYEDEAEQRWGNSDAYQEPKRRTRGYGKKDWAAIRAERESVVALADLLAEGVDATGSAAMDLAEAHRRHIDRWFYPCSHDMHGHLAAMYTADPRFAAHFERRGEGLAAFVSDAIRANGARYSD